MTATWPDLPPVVIPASARTWDGFRAWAVSDSFPTRGRVSYIGGAIHVDPNPERLGSHGLLRTELSSVLYGIVRRERLGLFLPARVLVSNAAADVSVEPDATFVSDRALDGGRVRLTQTADGADFIEVVGTPDVVVEIISPSSVEKDTRLLRERYHVAGVPEYWLIDARGERITFALLTHAPGGYTAAAPADGWLASPAFARAFRLTREPDEHGLWQYTLETRPLGATG